jgi:ABC-type transporter Mla maintaining outer membrane lipid asymmetry ATPase subunit MlaF
MEDHHIKDKKIQDSHHLQTINQDHHTIMISHQLEKEIIITDKAAHLEKKEIIDD